MQWFLRVTTLLSVVFLIKADLLDLYVQHMDEIMGTKAATRHLKDRHRNSNSLIELHSRNRRSVLESDIFQIANAPKQSIDIDDRIKGKTLYLMQTIVLFYRVEYKILVIFVFTLFCKIIEKNSTK